MFTQDNTTGYTDDQLTALNDELTARLDAVEEGQHAEADRADVEKAFADEVAGRDTLTTAQTIMALVGYTDQIAACTDECGDPDQNWEAETTTYAFDDGSKIADCNGVLTIPE